MTVQPVEPGSLLLLELLEDLDFPVGCTHSQHNTDAEVHDSGPAKWICRAVHNCVTNDGPQLYPACEAWARHVIARRGSNWMCSRCGFVTVSEEMCYVVGPLDP